MFPRRSEAPFLSSRRSLHVSQEVTCRKLQSGRWIWIAGDHLHGKEARTGSRGARRASLRGLRPRRMTRFPHGSAPLLTIGPPRILVDFGGTFGTLDVAALRPLDGSGHADREERRARLASFGP